MDKLVWTEDYSVGIPKIDDQHKQIISMINRLIEQPEATSDSEIVSDIVMEMTQYAQQHFQTEEQLMADHGYPDFDEHKQQHTAYKKKTVEFCTATMVGTDNIPDTIFNYLQDWWINHIQNTDMKYKPFFANKGI
ncbi:MAG: bacteriohemerythrin [Planctomycetota bacterium]|jgi:hemerythrin